MNTQRYERAPDVITYGEYLTACGHPPGTIEQYCSAPGRLLRDLAMEIDDVTSADVVAWLAARSDWAPNTRRKVVANLHLFFRWAEDTGRIDDDPTAILKPVRGAQPVPRPVPEDVYAACLAAAGGEDRLLLRLAGETGLRRAELAAIHSDDVTNGPLGPVLFVDGKGRRQRFVPLPDDLAAFVRSRGGWLFPSPYGGHMIPSAVGKRYKRLLGGRYTTHSLRHRFATVAYAMHHDIEAVRQLLGHDSVRTTQIYIASGDEELRRVAMGAWGSAA